MVPFWGVFHALPILEPVLVLDCYVHCGYDLDLDPWPLVTFCYLTTASRWCVDIFPPAPVSAAVFSGPSTRALGAGAWRRSCWAAGRGTGGSTGPASSGPTTARPPRVPRVGLESWQLLCAAARNSSPFPSRQKVRIDLTFGGPLCSGFREITDLG